jgi:sec-independent protein translocase protein TatA
MVALPLFGPIPGGPELLVILLVAVVLFGVPLVLLLGVLGYLRTGESSEERIAELERRIGELEHEQRDDGRPSRAGDQGRHGNGERDDDDRDE